jgi:hypothetical protein
MSRRSPENRRRRGPLRLVVETLSLDQARKIAGKYANGTVGSVAIVDTDNGPAIVAVNQQRRAGKTNFLMLEKRNGKYRVTTEQPFRHEWISGTRTGPRSWSMLMKTGFRICFSTGKDSSDARSLRRLRIVHTQRQNGPTPCRWTGETTLRGHAAH